MESIGLIVVSASDLHKQTGSAACFVKMRSPGAGDRHMGKPALQRKAAF